MTRRFARRVAYTATAVMLLAHGAPVETIAAAGVAIYALRVAADLNGASDEALEAADR